MISKYFTPQELSCRHCGQLLYDQSSLDKLNLLREIINKPLIITSSYRCYVHNKAEGGKDNSEHLLGKAYDIAIGNHNRFELYVAAKKAGFTGFGFASTFLHVDTGRRRSWDYGAASRKAWGLK